jgi:glucan phosphorylase
LDCEAATDYEADLPGYISMQRQMNVECCDRSYWNRKALLNIGRIGKFSSGRTIPDIWKIRPAVIGNFARAALLEE